MRRACKYTAIYDFTQRPTSPCVIATADGNLLSMQLVANMLNDRVSLLKLLKACVARGDLPLGLENDARVAIALAEEVQ